MASIAVMEEAEAENSRRLPVGAAPGRGRVVVAEDYPEFRWLLTDAFESAGYSVTECHTGRELYDTLLNPRAQDIVAVVSDHRMPGLLGLQVLEKLQDRRPRVPFILITAFGEHALHRRAKELGVDLVVHKPLDEEALVATVAELVGRH